MSSDAVATGREPELSVTEDATSRPESLFPTSRFALVVVMAGSGVAASERLDAGLFVSDAEGLLCTNRNAREARGRRRSYTTGSLTAGATER